MISGRETGVPEPHAPRVALRHEPGGRHRDERDASL